VAWWLWIPIALATLVAIALAWRRFGWPCPPWLTCLLENPYTQALLGPRALLERAGIEPGHRVLDVGCGPGRLALPAARRVGPTGRLVALDLQPAMLRRLEARLQREGLQNVETREAAIGDGRVEEDAFDRALLVTVLGEVHDRAAALREIRDALVPGGVLVVGELIPDPHYVRRARVRRLAEAAGFRFDATHGSWWAFTMRFVKPGPGEE
jgi:ubiquinone/menaquinone biosynthesis C-methylase UbiE